MPVSTRSDSAPPSARFSINRRVFLAALPVALAGCAGRTGARPALEARRVLGANIDPYYVAMYGPMPDERFPVPATDLRHVDPAYYRREVEYDSTEPPGTIIVDAEDKYLYLVQPQGRAMRYGIGVGREGFGWAGQATIRRKAAWPRWTPPAEMVERDPEAAKWAGGMPPGLDNPLGARALYLYQGGRDTLYRIHGTNEPWSIGSNVSSGCIRLINQDIVDLYDRVPIGSRVVVLQSGGGLLSGMPGGSRLRGALSTLL